MHHSKLDLHAKNKYTKQFQRTSEAVHHRLYWSQHFAQYNYAGRLSIPIAAKYLKVALKLTAKPSTVISRLTLPKGL